MAERILSRTQGGAEGVICVRQSMVIKGDKENVLAVRLHNGSDYIIDGVSLRVEYLDRADGTPREAKEITVNGLMGLPGTDFILPDISVPSEREAANIKIYAFTSGDYYYRISDDCKTIESEVRTGRKNFHGAAESKTKGGTRIKLYALYAVFVAVLFALSLAAGFSGIFNGGESAGNNFEIVREIGDQDV